MRILELFSGTQSVGKVARELGWDVVSLDIEDYKGKHAPTIKTDIMEWDYKKAYAPKHFDVVWASPPCVYYYCRLQHINLNRKRKANGELWQQEDWERDKTSSDEVVKRTLAIIDYFEPTTWFLENPQTGLLKDREIMQGVPFVDVDFCMYSDWGYRKRTRIWTNVKDFDGKTCDRKCGNMDSSGKKHRLLQRKGKGQSTKLQRYRIPPKLIRELLV